MQNPFVIINECIESSIRGLCNFYGHFWGMGHLLRACKLSIRPEILGVLLGIQKHKTRRVSDFLGHIYATYNFTSLFSALVFSQNSIWCLVYILIETARDETRVKVWRVHSSCLPRSRPVLVSSRSSRKKFGKSYPNQRTQMSCLIIEATFNFIS